MFSHLKYKNLNKKNLNTKVKNEGKKNHQKDVIIIKVLQYAIVVTSPTSIAYN